MQSLAFCYGNLGKLIHVVSENEEIVEQLRKALQTTQSSFWASPIKHTSQLSSSDLGSKCVKEDVQLIECHGIFRVLPFSWLLYEVVFSQFLLNKNAFLLPSHMNVNQTGIKFLTHHFSSKHCRCCCIFFRYLLLLTNSVVFLFKKKVPMLLLCLCIFR